MEKILLPIDSGHLNMNILNFACYITDLTNSTLTGAFLDYENDPISKQSKYLSYDERTELKRFTYNNDNLSQVEENRTLFNDTCTKKGIRFNVSHFSIEDIGIESRFSDLIIMDPGMTDTESVGKIPSEILKNLLMETECPVIIAPENYKEVNEIIHCYDGSRSSVFAIKQFTYLFPELTDLRCILLQVNKDSEWSIDKQYDMKQWLKAHYSQCGFQILYGDVENELEKFLKSRPSGHAFVTMGAYGRNSFSNLLKESRANILIRTTGLPIFISHL